LPIATGATVTLAHVVPGSLPARARREAEKDARGALVSEVLHAAKVLRPDVTIRHTVTVGVPAQEIGALASRLKADLTVMGRGGGRPLRDSLLGSTAERVARQARTPVLVVRLPARGPYRRPALGLDIDDAAEAVLGMLFRVLPGPRRRFTVVHAHDPPYLGLVYASLSFDETAKVERQLRHTAAVHLDELVARAMPDPSDAGDERPVFKMYIRHGDPRTVIKGAVKKLDTDLLLLGTRGYTAAAQLFLGTVAGDVLRDVRCDVLVVPPGRPHLRRR
jgi:nucleotide-binding universal stress UspA family protein